MAALSMIQTKQMTVSEFINRLSFDSLICDETIYYLFENEEPNDCLISGLSLLMNHSFSVNVCCVSGLAFTYELQIDRDSQNQRHIGAALRFLSHTTDIELLNLQIDVSIHYPKPMKQLANFKRKVVA